MKTGKLSGKIAVITGGSSGIGLATAKRFVEEGAYVFITGRRQAELDKAVAEIGSNVTGVQGDVSNLDDLDRLYKEVETNKGKLDVLRQPCILTSFRSATDSRLLQSAFLKSLRHGSKRTFLIVTRNLAPCR
jgi:enoyl-[acyl-carrier-protein] reductase (NADH)